MNRMNTTRFLTAAAALLLSSLALAGNGPPPDPGDPGPLAVTRVEYNLGDTAFMPTGFPGPVELNAVVYYPTDLSQGPFPLVVFLHGRHATCYQGGSAFLEWPCGAGHQSIPSYLGYEYNQSVLATWGYIVASVGANGINARDNSVGDLGMQARAELMQKHLDLWNDWNSPGGAPPFDTLFSGAVDLQNVGTMGHSRGGEGVAKHYVYNQSLGSPYGIVAVLPLAPVDFTRPDVSNVPLEVILPYCDGDVNDLQGVHFVDDVRYAPGDPTPKHTTLVMGAIHNFFNRIWTPGEWPAGTADDWVAFTPGGSADLWCGPTVPGNHRLTPEQQRATGKAYMNGFFRRYIGGELAFAALHKGDDPPPPSALTTEIHQSYLPPDSPGTRLDVNRLLTAADLSVNFQGGAVTMGGLNPDDLCGGELPQPQHCLATQPTTRQPHTVPSARSGRRGLSQNRFGWDDSSAFLENDLPGVDVSALAVLQFRSSVNYLDSRNGGDQDFTVTLADGSGNSDSVSVGSFSGSLYFPPGEIPSGRPVPKIFLNTVRLPLWAFPDVDLTNIQSVRFDFNTQGTGALLMSDIQFAD